MNRLWMRFSYIISLFFLVLVLLPLGTVLVLEQARIVNFRDEETTAEQNADDFSARDVPEVLVGITAVVGTIGVILGIWLSRGLSAPIVKMAVTAQQIGAGDLSQRVPVPTRRDELTELAVAFNEMAAALQHAETLRTNLLADVSHELRTPLAALSGQLHAGLDHVYDLDEEAIANLYGQTQFLIRLVEDLHLLAQAEARQLPLQWESVNLNALWSEIAANFTVLAEEKQVHFAVELVEEMPTIKADSVRLRQIFTNLLANALQYSASGESILVQGEWTKTAVTVLIQDTGEGISPEHLPYLFDRFYRTDASRSRESGGSGLGLAIVKALVEAHDGTITVSSPGKLQGTIFSLTFPILAGKNDSDFAVVQPSVNER